MQFSRYLIVLLIVLASARSNAGLIGGLGSFNIGFASPSQGQTSLSGDFTFTFDESVLTGIGSETFRTNPLTTLTVTSGIVGSTVFDTGNSAVTLFYNSGALTRVTVGGILDNFQSGPASTITSAVDDWRATLEPGNFTATGGYSNGSISGLDTSIFGFGSLEITSDPGGDLGGDPNSVPAPSTLLLLALGILGLGCRAHSARESLV